MIGKTRIGALRDFLREEFKKGNLRIKGHDLHRVYAEAIPWKRVGTHSRQNCWNALTKIAVYNGDGTWSIRHEVLEEAKKQGELPMTVEKPAEDQYRKQVEALDADETEITREMLDLEQEYDSLVARSKSIQARQQELGDRLEEVFRNRIGMMPWFQFKILKRVVDMHHAELLARNGGPR